MKTVLQASKRNMRYSVNGNGKSSGSSSNRYKDSLVYELL